MGNQYYKKYTKQEDEKPSYIKLFFGAFFMMLILFVVIAVHLFSSVDTAIGENDEGDLKESGLGVKHLIDSRLKFIQMEDNNKLPSNNVEVNQTKEEAMGTTTNSPAEVQVQTFGGQDYSNPYGNSNSFSATQTTFPNTETNTIKHPTSISQQHNTSSTSSTVYKVFIGSYSTLEQARVAQNIVQDANLGVTSFVKTLSNGTYTIQVGSYNNLEKAQSLTNELRRNHFPARMVQE